MAPTLALPRSEELRTGEGIKQSEGKFKMKRSIYLWMGILLAGAMVACGAPATVTGLPPTVTASVATSVPTTASSATTLPATSIPTTQPTVAPTATVGAEATAAPTRIQFAAGATEAEVPGHVGAGGVASYILHAEQGQPMTVMINSFNNDVYLTIYGADDGQPLVRAASDSTIFGTTLTVTQDYIIEAVAGGGASDFDMVIEIPQRITFAAGATSATVKGTASAGIVVSYVLKAQAGQTMTATLTSATNDVFLTIYGVEDGQPLVRSALGQTTWTGQLPGRQDYIIKAVQTGDPVDYTLTVTVK